MCVLGHEGAVAPVNLPTEESSHIWLFGGLYMRERERERERGRNREERYESINISPVRDTCLIRL